MKDIWEEALKDMAAAGMTEEEFINNFRKAMEEADNKYAHEAWLEEVEDAREDFIDSFLNYVETLFGENETFNLEPEDEKYMRERIIEMEKDLLDQKDRFNKIAKTIEDKCREWNENQNVNTNKSKNEGGKQKDTEMIRNWLNLFDLI